MRTLISECNSGDLKTDTKTFEQTWCHRCSMPDCTLARFAREDLMAQRNKTWRQRYFGDHGPVDLSIPKFAQIHALDFPNLLEKAIKLEISERRGDWSVPSTDTPLVMPVKPATTPPPAPEEEDEEEPVPHEPAPPTAPPFASTPVMATPRRGNVPDQEIMIGGPVGAPPPTTSNTPAADPWAPPPRPSRVVIAPGTRIQIGKKP
jgi:hypothetical protein